MGSRSRAGLIDQRPRPAVFDDLDTVLATDMRLDYYPEHVEWLFWDKERMVGKIAMTRGVFAEKMVIEIEKWKIKLAASDH